jgi:hypothetical protein
MGLGAGLILRLDPSAQRDRLNGIGRRGGFELKTANQSQFSVVLNSFISQLVVLKLDH